MSGPIQKLEDSRAASKLKESLMDAANRGETWPADVQEFRFSGITTSRPGELLIAYSVDLKDTGNSVVITLDGDENAALFSLKTEHGDFPDQLRKGSQTLEVACAYYSQKPPQLPR